MENIASAPTATYRRPETWLALGLLLLTALSFWPVLTWLTTQTFAHEQLKQSFFLMLMAGAWIAWEQRRALRPHPVLDNSGIICLCVSYGCVAGAYFLRTPFLVLGGVVAASAAAVQIVFGSRALRRTVPLLAAFGLLIVFVLAFPVLDWPLRKMAGVESVRLLQSFGLVSQLQLQIGPEVELLLVNAHGRFIVKTECNGFGLITSSLLLGTVCLLYRRASWWKFPGLLALSLLLAFSINLMRIAAIVEFAPYLPGRYGLLHETAGLVALYSGLGAVWLLTGWQPKRRPAGAR
jgi:exosortase/archaeosortase family protein